jgi:hypothetical protein
MIRLLIMVISCTYAYFAWGAGAAVDVLALFAILGFIFGGVTQREEEDRHEAQEELYERLDHARRGSEVDPTRPGYDTEHPLLLTQQYRRVK